MWAIIETDRFDDVPEDESERCYLNHAYLSSGAFGALDMAWTAESELEAEGMAARITGRSQAPSFFQVVQID